MDDNSVAQHIGFLYNSLRWRHNDHAAVSNHQPHGCLLNRLFRRKPKKTSKLRVTGLCAGNSPGTGEFPAQMASYAENVSIWWRHHVVGCVWNILLSMNARHSLGPWSVSSLCSRMNNILLEVDIVLVLIVFVYSSGALQACLSIFALEIGTCFGRKLDELVDHMHAHSHTFISLSGSGVRRVH